MEYVELVNKIVAAEHSAKEIAREVKEREVTLEADLRQETEKMRERYLSRARRRVEQVEQTEAEAAQESLAALDGKLSAAMSAVESSYQKNKDRWVDTLFSMIVGGPA